MTNTAHHLPTLLYEGIRGTRIHYMCSVFYDMLWQYQVRAVEKKYVFGNMETLEEQSLVFLKKKVEEHDLEVV